MAEYIEVQNVAETQQIDHRREMNQVINTQVIEQTDTIKEISNQLDDIASTITDVQPNSVDLTEVIDKIDEIDPTLVTMQTKDILSIVQEQQDKIDLLQEQNNTLENKLDLILQKLEET